MTAYRKFLTTLRGLQFGPGAVRTRHIPKRMGGLTTVSGYPPVTDSRKRRKAKRAIR